MANLNSQKQTLQDRLLSLSVDTTLAGGNVTIVAQATPPSSAIRPQPKQDALLALGAGLLLGIALAFLLEFLDDSIKNREDLQLATGPEVPLLGLIPGVRPARGAEVISIVAPNSVAAEAYRSLRTAVYFMGLERGSCFEITSPRSEEGKTTTSANLAVAAARAGKTVILVDCDLRRPSIHSIFGLPNDAGFTSVLLGEPLANVLQKVPEVDNLFVLTSGPLPPNPSELLTSTRGREVLEMLHDQDALVLIDTPPLLGLTDAAALAASVDAVVLVTRAGYSTRRSCRNALDLLAQVGAPVLGTVLTRSKDDESIGSYTERVTHRRRRRCSRAVGAGAVGGLELLTAVVDRLRVAVAVDARHVCAWHVEVVGALGERARDRTRRDRAHDGRRRRSTLLGRSNPRSCLAARSAGAFARAPSRRSVTIVRRVDGDRRRQLPAGSTRWLVITLTCSCHSTSRRCRNRCATSATRGSWIPLIAGHRDPRRALHRPVARLAGDRRLIVGVHRADDHGRPASPVAEVCLRSTGSARVESVDQALLEVLPAHVDASVRRRGGRDVDDASAVRHTATGCGAGPGVGWCSRRRASAVSIASPQWNVGLVDAPIERFLDPDFAPSVRWLPRPARGEFVADPFGLPDRRARLARRVVRLHESSWRHRRGRRQRRADARAPRCSTSTRTPRTRTC